MKKNNNTKKKLSKRTETMLSQLLEFAVIEIIVGGCSHNKSTESEVI